MPEALVELVQHLSRRNNVANNEYSMVDYVIHQLEWIHCFCYILRATVELFSYDDRCGSFHLGLLFFTCFCYLIKLADPYMLHTLLLESPIHQKYMSTQTIE